MADVNKCLERFRKTLREGAPYEAQQMVKTMYHRLRSRKRLEASRELLAAAAKDQLSKEQVRCGSELALLLLEAYEVDGVPPNDEHALEDILQILESFPEEQDAAVEHARVAKAALKWAMKGPTSSRSVECLHTEMGQYVWMTKDMDGLQVATSHLARGNDMQLFAECLQQVAEAGDSSEADLVLVRAVLQVLSVPGKSLSAQLQHARKLAAAFLALHTLPQDLPLLHFLTLLQEALERPSLSLLRLLRREYRPSLSRDNSLLASLDAIEANHFGVRGSAGGFDGLLGNMMRMLTASD